jgi:hypothetical protein
MFLIPDRRSLIPVVDTDEKETRCRRGTSRTRAIAPLDTPGNVTRRPAPQADVDERASDRADHVPQESVARHTNDQRGQTLV